jgi:hypothetical protein
MDAVWLGRLRWRRRGAWLWPTFVGLTLVDGVIVNGLPMAGDGQSVVGGVALALVLNLVFVLIVARPLGALLRRRRGDLPVGVARDYAGTAAVLGVTAAMLALGLLHHHVLVREQRAMDDAVVRAEAYIGDHAPATFRVNVVHSDTYAIEPGSLYRTCVPSLDGARTYCVVVDRGLPFAQSVRPAGSEPNWILFQGAN